MAKQMERRYTIYQSTDFEGKKVWWREGPSGCHEGETKHFLTWQFVSREVMSKKAKLVKI